MQEKRRKRSASTERRSAARKRAENALRESTERLSLALDAAGSNTWDLDLRTGAAIWSDGIFQELGYPPAPGGKATLEMWRSRLHPGDLPRVMEALEQARRSRSRFVSEHRLLRADNGAVLWHSSAGRFLYNEAGEATRLLGVSFDITERKRAEEALRERVSRYRTVVETSTDGFWVQDTTGRILEVNDRYLLRSGYTREELLGLSLFDIEARRSREQIEADLARSEHPRSRIIEAHHRAKDGSIWPVEVSSNFLPHDGGRHYSFLRDITERKRVEAELARLAAIIESSDDAIISRGNDRRVMTWNAAAERMFGYSAEETIGRDIDILIPAEEREATAKRRSLLEEGRPVPPFDAVRLAKDGRRIDVSITLSPIKDASGGMTGVSLMVRDITERKQAETALREREFRYRAIVETSADGFWVMDTSTGRILQVNDRYLQRSGYTREELLGLSLFDIDAKQSREDIAAGLANTAHKGSWTLEAWHRAKNGSLWPVEVSTIYLPGEGGRRYSFLRDITERKRAEDSLRQSEERYRVLAEASHDLIILVNRRWEVEYTNTFAARQFGATPQDLIGKRLADIFPPEIADRQQANLQQVFDSGQSLYVEAPFVFLGNAAWLGSWLVPIRDKSTEGIAILVVSRDITERKRAEMALRERESRYRALVETSTDGFWVLDTRGRILDVNDRYLLRSGYTREELLGMSIFDIDARQSPEEIKASLAKSGHHAMRLLEVMHRAKDGSVWPVEISTIYLPVDGGRYYSFLRDITERKRAEDALREREARYRAIVETSTDGFWVLGMAGQILEVNDRYLQRSGYTREELLGLSVFDIDAKRTREEIEAIAANRRHQAIAIFETLHRAKDGSIWPVEVSTVYLPDEGGRRYAFLRDITERRRAEDALRDSEVRFSAVFRFSPIGIAIDRLEDGKFLEVNDAMSRIWGYTREEAIGRTVVELDIYANPARRAELLEELRAHGQIEGFEFDFRRRNGEVGTLVMSGRVIELLGEQYLIAMVMDVTDRKRLEEVRLRSQKLQALGTLAGGIAHDFNNVLLAINGNAKLALEDLEPQHPARRSVAEIAKAGKRASDLVRRILAFSRPRSEVREALQLRPVLEEAVKLLRSTLPATIEFRSRFADEVPPVAADATQVHEAVVNLAANAAYAIGAGTGWIEFALEPVQVDADLALKVPGLRRGRYARLSVSDNGCGMDEATVGRIFDAFFTTKPIGQGTGLGLSMVHGILQGHGGAVGVRSAPGGGSSFELYFPAAAAQATREAREQVIEAAPAAGRRVLYVDDEESLVFLMDRVLARLGHKVSGFTDPWEALREFRSRPQEFDVVVTDVSMPGMSGFDLARGVLAVRADIPVLMTTGYIQPENEDTAHAAGIRELILKPNTVDDLGAVLDRLFRSGNGPDGNPSG